MRKFSEKSSHDAVFTVFILAQSFERHFPSFWAKMTSIAYKSQYCFSTLQSASFESFNWTLRNCAINSLTRRFVIKILEIPILDFDHQVTPWNKNLLNIVLDWVYFADWLSFIILWFFRSWLFTFEINNHESLVYFDSFGWWVMKLFVKIGFSDH